MLDHTTELQWTRKLGNLTEPEATHGKAHEERPFRRHSEIRPSPHQWSRFREGIFRKGDAGFDPTEVFFQGGKSEEYTDHEGGAGQGLSLLICLFSSKRTVLPSVFSVMLPFPSEIYPHSVRT